MRTVNEDGSHRVTIPLVQSQQRACVAPIITQMTLPLRLKGVVSFAGQTVDTA